METGGALYQQFLRIQKHTPILGTGQVLLVPSPPPPIASAHLFNRFDELLFRQQQQQRRQEPLPPPPIVHVAPCCMHTQTLQRDVATVMCLPLEHFRIIQQPSKNQIKGRWMLPSIAVEFSKHYMAYRTPNDYIIVVLESDKALDRDDIFLTAVSTMYGNNNSGDHRTSSILNVPLKITARHLPGRTKGYQFSVRVVLIMNDPSKPVETRHTKPFMLWSHPSQKGFPRRAYQLLAATGRKKV